VGGEVSWKGTVLTIEGHTKGQSLSLQNIIGGGGVGDGRKEGSGSAEQAPNGCTATSCGDKGTEGVRGEEGRARYHVEQAPNGWTATPAVGTRRKVCVGGVGGVGGHTSCRQNECALNRLSGAGNLLHHPSRPPPPTQPIHHPSSSSCSPASLPPAPQTAPPVWISSPSTAARRRRRRWPRHLTARRRSRLPPAPGPPGGAHGCVGSVLVWVGGGVYVGAATGATRS
jgi:hypothetical protein